MQMASNTEPFQPSSSSVCNTPLNLNIHLVYLNRRRRLSLLNIKITHRFPNSKVDLVSASLKLAGEQHIIIVVLAFPPRDSCKILVSLESLYGMWVLFPSAKADITFPRADKDLLMFLASSRTAPSAPVLLTLKTNSTSWNQGEKNAGKKGEKNPFTPKRFKKENKMRQFGGKKFLKRGEK